MLQCPEKSKGLRHHRRVGGDISVDVGHVSEVTCFEVPKDLKCCELHSFKWGTERMCMERSVVQLGGGAVEEARSSGMAHNFQSSSSVACVFNQFIRPVDHIRPVVQNKTRWAVSQAAWLS